MNTESYSNRVIKAKLANEHPIEKLVASTYEKVCSTAENADDLHKKLGAILFLCDKGLRILPMEMDVRGAKETLSAIETVEQIRAEVVSLRKDLELAMR